MSTAFIYKPHAHRRTLFPLELAPADATVPTKSYTNGSANKLSHGDRAAHSWYRFVLSFPPHLVQEYIGRFDLAPGATILDPFCGTGTTLVEGKQFGLKSCGIEANKVAHFASSVKCDWDVNPQTLSSLARTIESETREKILQSQHLTTLPKCQAELLLTDSISPLPLHKTLVLRDVVKSHCSPVQSHLLLALATSTVKNASNLHFGPEVGVSRNKKVDSPVVDDWLKIVDAMCEDVAILQRQRQTIWPSEVILGDARSAAANLPDRSVDAVFTSPPYPNEKDYTRTTRLESVLLGFLSTMGDLRAMKQGLLRSNSRNVYKGDSDDKYVRHFTEVTNIADEIEAKRCALGKTSGFEKTYHKIVRHYFGGMARHLESLKPCLKKGAMLGYVVGDQASFFQVHIATGKILAKIAEHLGYEVVYIDLFRTRFATATKLDMNEEVVVLRWNR